MLSLRAAAAAGAAAVGLCVVVSASSPTFWTVGTQTAFLEGDVDNLSIDADGRVHLGPSASVLAETSAPFLWTLHAGRDGSLLAGSGNEGRFLRVKDGKVTTAFDAGELEVHAVAPGADGAFYVGTSPDGKIYHVAADGTSRVFFDPDDKYIWSLVVDRAGNLFAATGDKGVIYRITPDGKGAPFYRTNATNVVTLAVAADGQLLAGTESPGRIYRIDPAGKAFVLLDSPYREIHALKLATDGTIYAAAVNGGAVSAPQASEAPSPEPPRDPVPTVSAEITGVSAIESPITPPTATSAPRPPQRPGRGAIYRIHADGLWDLMWDSGADSPFDLLIEPGGSLLVGTGTEGKIYRVSGDPARATLLARAGARQVTALVREASGRVIGAASNPGKIFALSPEPARRGVYESDIRDAGTVATWGVIRWRATLNGGRIEVATRSGNTSTPDETWSAWSKPYTNAGGEQMASPNARYLQWRLTMTSESGSGPVLTSVTAAYLPRNLRPTVGSITVHPPGTVFQRPFSTGDPEIAGYVENTMDGRTASASGEGRTPSAPALGRRLYQKGLQTFVWKAEDGNDDRLQYDISYRREGETVWRPLQRGVWDPIFVWDTTSVPDGTYIVKIAASDAASNSPANALTGERESTSFDVDNTPPRVELQAPTRAGSRTVIPFVVTDEQSAIQRVEYSLDASRWRVVYPKDGIADSRREEFQVTLEEGEASRSVIVRVTDAMNNVATAGR